MKEFLDPLFERYHSREFLSSDPLEYVHRYSDPWDQEAVALVCALLAYGNVKQIRRSVEDLLSRMEGAAESPAGFVRDLSRKGGRGPRALQGFVHRFNVGEDLVLLLRLLARSWSEHGSLGAHLLTHLEDGAPHIESALSGLIEDWRSWAGAGLGGSASYLLTSPRDGSACKRWCMLLRWMGRKDALDPGLWGEHSPLRRTFPEGRFLRPSQLVIPLDTHTGRISQYLGLTRRRTLGWRAALDVTESLRRCDPADPVKYDFAIARLGILDLCQKSFRVEICRNCELLLACRFASQSN